MPGRPRKMARKVAEFEEVAIYLSADVFYTIPLQYRRQPNPRDPLNRAWNHALKATGQASIELERLGDLLRAKAGISEPGPSALFVADDLENGK